jgi:hypothetical protein
LRESKLLSNDGLRLNKRLYDWRCGRLLRLCIILVQEGRK